MSGVPHSWVCRQENRLGETRKQSRKRWRSKAPAERHGLICTFPDRKFPHICKTASRRQTGEHTEQKKVLHNKDGWSENTEILNLVQYYIFLCSSSNGYRTQFKRHSIQKWDMKSTFWSFPPVLKDIVHLASNRLLLLWWRQSLQLYTAPTPRNIHYDTTLGRKGV